MNGRSPHGTIDQINLAMDRRIAAKIRKDPAIVNIAKANLRRWIEGDAGFLHPAHTEWQDILQFLEPDELADFIEADTPKANRLRQSSPFTGIITEEERRAILCQYEEATA